MKIFGDDGFRDEFGKGLLNKNFLNNFFKSLNIVLYQKKIRTIVVGYDTRGSYKRILDLISKNLVSLDRINIINKPISTPAIQLISKEYKTFGIMITASHFCHKYNGFKFFLRGKKISKKFEKKIIQKINKQSNSKIKFITKKVRIKINPYISMINKKFRFKNTHKVLFDCANGSISTFYKEINFLSNTKIINTNFKKNKINDNCGTNFLKKNLKKTYYKFFEYCLAFDGDGDRLSVSKKNYGVIETEKLALIYYLYLNKKKNIVGTEITNPWLKEKLKLVGKKLYLTKVGDRNVINKKKKINAAFGFETSGHFCFNDTMDGLFSAGLFLEILNKKKSIILDVLKMKISYSNLVYRTENKNFFLIKNKIQNSSNHKVIIRRSIWEEILKIYVFYKKKNPQLNKIQKFLEKISLK